MLGSSFIRFVLLALSLAGTARAQQFSADIRGTENGQPMTEEENPYKRLYVSADRLRVEGEKGGHSFVIIVDNDVASELYPDSKTYETGFGWSGFVRTFVLPRSIDAICHRETSAKCGMTDRRHVQGRPAVGFSYVGHKGSRELGWIDEKLGLLLKYVEIDRRRGRTNTLELINIHEEPQPPELFKVPDDFHRITELGPQDKPAEIRSPEPPAEPQQ